MKPATEAYLTKFSVAAIAGYVGSEILTYLIWESFKKKGVSRNDRFIPHHYQIGMPMVLGGALMDSKDTKAPVIAGLGAGVIISDAKDFLNFIGAGFKSYQDAVGKYYPVQSIKGTYDLGMAELSMKRVHIDDSKPISEIYRDIAGLLVDLVVKDNDENEAGREHPAVFEQARRIVSDYKVDGHDHLAVLAAIQDWAKQGTGNMNYAYDIRKQGHDTFVHPAKMLELKSGDCDDSATLVASLGEAVGVPMGLCLVAQRPVEPQIYNHIFACGLLDEKYRRRLPKPFQNDRRYWDAEHGKVVVPLEVTHDVPFLYHPRYVRRLIVEIPK